MAANIPRLNGVIKLSVFYYKVEASKIFVKFTQILPENQDAVEALRKNLFFAIRLAIFAFTQEALPGGDMMEARESAMIKITERDIDLWEVGQPVGMAGKARPTTHGIAVNLAYTPPARRRRGYASACVAALSQLLLDAGWKFCCLFTDSSNPTSNHIY